MVIVAIVLLRGQCSGGLGVSHSAGRSHTLRADGAPDRSMLRTNTAWPSISAPHRLASLKLTAPGIPRAYTGLDATALTRPDTTGHSGFGTRGTGVATGLVYGCGRRREVGVW